MGRDHPIKVVGRIHHFSCRGLRAELELVLKAITYGSVITVDALNVSTPSRSRG